MTRIRHTVVLWACSLAAFGLGWGCARFAGTSSQEHALPAHFDMSRQLQAVGGKEPPVLRAAAPEAGHRAGSNVLPAPEGRSARVTPRDHASKSADAPLSLGDAERTALVQRFLKESNPEARRELLATLRRIGTSDVASLALQLASSGDPMQRADGLVLLTAFAARDSSARQQVLTALQTERDPAVLAQLANTLQPFQFSPQDRSAVEAWYRTLSQHEDPGLRAQSVRALAQWEWNPAATEARVYEAMGDVDPNVRRAAMQSMVIGHVTSDRLKSRLFSALNDPNSDRATVGFASMVLRRVPLTQQEYSWLDAKAGAIDRQAP